MSGTTEGGKAAAQTNKERYGKDFYAKIGAKSNESWERNGRKPRGFSAVSREQRAEWGRKGGSKSKRGTAK